MGEYFDLFCHHKGAVETYSELADQLRIRLLIAGEVGEKLCGAGFGDGAKMGDDVFPRHANTIVRNGERTRVFVEGNVDTKGRIVAKQTGVLDGTETQLVDSI